MFSSFTKTPAKRAMDKIVAKLNAENFKYDFVGDKGDDIGLWMQGDNFDDGAARFRIIVDSDGKSVSFKLYTLVKGIDEDDLSGAFAFCNAMNKKYRWTRVYVDDDNDISIAMDAEVDQNSIGEQCFTLLNRMTSICDDIAGELKNA